MTYDGVILAAGRNTRLKGIVPSYYKPLVVVNGRPLIISLTHNLLQKCEDVTIVASPENCGPIIELLSDNKLLTSRVNIVIQPTARGPGEGLLRGLRCCTEPRIMMVCGDNSIPAKEFSILAENDANWVGPDYERAKHVITVSTVLTTDETEALRFTRVAEGMNWFLENEPGGMWQDGYYRCWISPLIFDRRFALNRLGNEEYYTNPSTEIKISKNFNVDDLLIRPIPGNSIDIGTSDSLLENS